MQKRPSSRTGGSARVDAILRYRSAAEGVLCSARCRELSRTGLTATIERPVFPGDLLRFDLEPASGGRSVMGLARVAWTGSDPEGAPGTSIMRMRFLSLGDVSEQALLEWLDELSDAPERPSSPHDDSSVRALGRAIADSLLPPPPVLPGAPPSTESSSGLTPAPIAVPNRPSIPPPPGLYVRVSRELTHAVESVGRVATSIAPPLPPPSNPPPAMAKRRPSVPAPATVPASMFPHPPSMFELDTPTVPNMAAVLPPPVSVPGTPPKAPSGGAAKKPPSSDSPSARRTAEVRQRLARFQKQRRDQTPLSVPVEDKLLQLRDDAPPSLMTAPAFARVSVPPPLPLGALLNAPPETTRRSTPAPAASVDAPPPPPPLGATSSSSWPALRVPPAVAALTHDEPVERDVRETIPPPASVPDMPSPDVSAPALDEDDAERVLLPRADRQPPPSYAPWSVPAQSPPRASARPWLALGLASLACGAGIAYLVYGTSLFRDHGAQVPAAGIENVLAARSAAAASPSEDVLAPMMPVPSARSGVVELNAPEQPADPFKPGAKPSPKQVAAPAPAAVAVPGSPPSVAKAKLAAPGAAALVPAPSPASATPAPGVGLEPVPIGPAKEIEPGDKLPPPAPLLPAALGGAVAAEADSPAAAQASGAPASRLERARGCLARGDIACATEVLRDASSEPELELWIETLRAKGDGLEARRAMKRFLETYPDGRRAAAYRRILNNANAQ